MKTFNLLLGLALGLIIGLLTSLSAILLGLLYFVTEPKKSKTNTGYRPFTQKREKMDIAFNHEYDTRLDAEKMLELFDEILQSRGRVTVEDVKTATGYPASFADRQVGWRSLYETKIERPLYHTKYRIFFPTPETL